MNEADPAETARLLREVIAAVERGELSADSSKAQGLLRQVQGAAVALEQMAAITPEDSEDVPE